MNKNLSIFIVLLLSISLCSASSLGSGQALVLSGVIFSIIATGIFFFIVALISNSKVMKVFFISLAFLSIVFMVGMMIIIINQYYSSFVQLVDTYNSLFILLLVLAFAGLIGLLVTVSVIALYSLKQKRGFID